MATVASRKKSMISSTGLQIDTPVVNNTLLNKAASQSTSLYQQCSSLRSRLLRIPDFSAFFKLAATPDSRQSTDPVTQLWDLFSLGIPLCYIFNLLPPPATQIAIDTNPAEFDTRDLRAKKRAIALFAMQISQVSRCEPFTVTDLWDRNSTDGLVKVINTVTTIVDQLPEDLFEAAPPSPPSLSTHESTDSLGESLASAPANAQEVARNNIIREIVETERKYVQDLEVMQKYSTALSQGNILAQDEIHFLFPNLNKLLNFQRKFLIRLESTAELPWQEQRWGLHFIESEDEFVVYEPYCANYTNAADLMLRNEQNLMTLNGLINAKSELPAFLIKPVQRICKYPLLLDSLIKASNPIEYPHYDELKDGSSAAKRITDKINEAQRRVENEQTARELEGRIEDWKGHHMANFGELILDDVFFVRKSGVDREYYVFLFEKIILCCKEAPLNNKKNGKSGSILKKPPSVAPVANGQPQKKTSPLLLKGRIFLNNVTQAVPVSSRNSTGGSTVSPYALEVWWRGDDDLEYFTLRCRTEEQLKQWESQINRLIAEVAQRRKVERGFHKAVALANSTSPALGLGRHMSASTTSRVHQHPHPHHDRDSNATLVTGVSVSAPHQHHDRDSTATTMTAVSVSGQQPHPLSAMYLGPPQITPLAAASMSPATSPAGPMSPYGGDDRFELTPNTPYAPPRSGYAAAYEGFEMDDEEFEEYPPSSAAFPSHHQQQQQQQQQQSSSSSGRITPSGRRGAATASMPPDAMHGHLDRLRAQTEDSNGPVMSQWRSNGVSLPPMPPPPPGAGGALPHRPFPRLVATASASNIFDVGHTRPTSSQAHHKSLRTQQSGTTLRSGQQQYQHQQHETVELSRGKSPSAPYPPSTAITNGSGSTTPNRARSASQPTAYNGPKHQAPPLPNGAGGVGGSNGWVNNGSTTSMSSLSSNPKRGSGSSQSTADSSDYSPNSSSPITPFGSSESSLTMGVRPVRSQQGVSFEGGVSAAAVTTTAHKPSTAAAAPASMSLQSLGPTIKVKVHYHDDIFVIQVPRVTEYEDLVDKVGKKIRLCEPRREEGPLRVKYRDEDGDMVSVGSTEDVQLAFETLKPGGLVTLYVT